MDMVPHLQQQSRQLHNFTVVLRECLAKIEDTVQKGLREVLDGLGDANTIAG